jgi:hypothetical protein
MLGNRLQRDDAQFPAALILATAFHGAVSLKISGRKSNLSCVRGQLPGHSRRG